MRCIALVTLLIGGFLLSRGEKVRFDNHRIYSAKIKNVEQLNALKSLEKPQSEIFYIEAPALINRKVEMVVPPHKFADINALFNRFQIENTITVENLQKLIDEEQPKQTPRASFGWEKYYELPAIYSWLDEQLEKFPDILTAYEVGTSYENRTIRAVKLSHKKGNPTIFIDSSIHAREWIAVATTTFLFNELLTSSDPEVKHLAENYDWVYVPVVNVDGYTYAHNVNRMWRKTRQPYGQCVGADPNRNYDFHHGEVGSSNDSCSENYSGPSAFSEPEIRAMGKFIDATDNIKLYLTFHSYGQLLLFPYGYTNERIPEYNDLIQIGGKALKAIKRRYGSVYTCGNSNDDYPSSGETIDYVYGVKKVPLVYTIELRDKGKYGFVLPADQIIPNALEVLDGLKAIVKEAKALNYL